MATSVSNVISNYTYTYNNQMRAKLDKDDNGVWGRDEVQNYADAYKSATGKTLDVDKIMEKYANEDGEIRVSGQEQMLKDDALGFSVLKSTQDASTSTSTSSSTSSSSSTTSSASSAMTQDRKYAVMDAVSAFTYSYNGKLQPLLDKNDDGMWSKDELQNYSDAYKKATGKTLDVDALMEKYGNDNGLIDPKNQGLMKTNDALGLSSLKTEYDKALAMKSTTYNDAKSTLKEKSSSDYSLEDVLGTMSSSRKAYFSVMTNKYDSQSSLLSAFGMGSGSSYAGSTNILNMSGMLQSMSSLQMAKFEYGKNSENLASAMSGQAMNFTL